MLGALPERDTAMWATAFYAGLRRGELQALRVSAVDLAGSRIHVAAGWDQYEGEIDPTTYTSRRTVPLLAVLREMGHSKIQTTFGTYGHLFPGSHDQVRERMDAYLLDAEVVAG